MLFVSICSYCCGLLAYLQVLHLLLHHDSTLCTHQLLPTAQQQQTNCCMLAVFGAAAVNSRHVCVCVCTLKGCISNLCMCLHPHCSDVSVCLATAPCPSCTLLPVHKKCNSLPVPAAVDDICLFWSIAAHNRKCTLLPMYLGLLKALLWCCRRGRCMPGTQPPAT